MTYQSEETGDPGLIDFLEGLIQSRSNPEEEEMKERFRNLLDAAKGEKIPEGEFEKHAEATAYSMMRLYVHYYDKNVQAQKDDIDEYVEGRKNCSTLHEVVPILKGVVELLYHEDALEAWCLMSSEVILAAILARKNAIKDSEEEAAAA